MAPAPMLPPLVRELLIAHGLVRNPGVAAPAGDPDRPPAWMDRRDGVPAPGDLAGVNRGTTIVVAINTATGVVGPRFYGELRTDGIEIIIRATKPEIARAFEHRLQPLLHDQRGYLLTADPASRIEESLLFRALQPLEFSRQAVTFSTEYTFERKQDHPLLPAA